MSSIHRAFASGVALLAAGIVGVVASCGSPVEPDLGAAAARPAAVALRLSVAAIEGANVRVRVTYRRQDDTVVELSQQDIALLDAPSQPVSIRFDLSPCLGDPQRAPAGPECTVSIDVILRQGDVELDRFTVGPLALRAGSSTAPPNPVVLIPTASITVTPATVTLLAGGTQQLVAALVDAQQRPLQRSPVWTSESPAVATVSATGLVTAVAPGTAVIRASNGTASGTSTITVQAAPAIRLNPAGGVSFTAPQQQALPAEQVVTVENGGGAPLTGLAVGTISYGPGATGWLTATLGGATAPAPLTLRPTRTDLAPGTYTATVPVTAPPPAANSPQVVTVTYTVTAGPALALGETRLDVTTVQGQAPPPRVVTIVNSGGGGPGALTGLQASVAYDPQQPTGWLSAVLTQQATPSLLQLAYITGPLAPGTYGATVTVSSPVALNGPQALRVILTVAQGPVLTLSSSQVGVAAPQNGPVPAAVPVTVTNGGGGGPEALVALAVGTVTFQPQVAPWLTATLGGATSPATLTLAVTRTDLAPGAYTATVPVSSPAQTNGPQAVTVTYTVGQGAVLQLAPSTVSFSSAPQVAPAAQAVAITNIGAGGPDALPNLAVTGITYGQGQPTGWLTAALSQPVSPASLQLSAAALPEGSYSATVTVSSPAASNGAQSVLVSYSVTAAPSLVAAPAALTFNGVVGVAPAAQQLALSNGGGGGPGAVTGVATAVQYAPGQPTGWLLVDAQGRSVTPLSATVTAAATLPPGAYTASITVTSPAAGNSPVTVPVSYTVIAAPAFGASVPSLAFTAPAGQAPPAQAVEVTNTGGGGPAALTGVQVAVLVPPGQPPAWLAVTANRSVSPLQLSARPVANLDPGTYTATIRLTSPDAPVPLELPVTHIVTVPAPLRTLDVRLFPNLPIEAVRVVSAPAGIDCTLSSLRPAQGTCSAQFPENGVVTFTGSTGRPQDLLFGLTAGSLRGRVIAATPLQLAQQETSTIRVVAQTVDFADATGPFDLAWVGGAPGATTDWDAADNWVTAGGERRLPVASDRIFVANRIVFTPRIADGLAREVRQVVNESGARIDFRNGATLVLSAGILRPAVILGGAGGTLLFRSGNPADTSAALQGTIDGGATVAIQRRVHIPVNSGVGAGRIEWRPGTAEEPSRLTLPGIANLTAQALVMAAPHAGLVQRGGDILIDGDVTIGDGNPDTPFLGFTGERGNFRFGGRLSVPTPGGVSVQFSAQAGHQTRPIGPSPSIDWRALRDLGPVSVNTLGDLYLHDMDQGGTLTLLGTRPLPVRGRFDNAVTNRVVATAPGAAGNRIVLDDAAGVAGTILTISNLTFVRTGVSAFFNRPGQVETLRDLTFTGHGAVAGLTPLELWQKAVNPGAVTLTRMRFDDLAAAPPEQRYLAVLCDGNVQCGLGAAVNDALVGGVAPTLAVYPRTGTQNTTVTWTPPGPLTPRRTLSVVRGTDPVDVPGDIRVVSSPAAIDCTMQGATLSGACSAQVAEGTTITLTVTPLGPRDVFKRWRGQECASAARDGCTFLMHGDGDQSVALESEQFAPGPRSIWIGNATPASATAWEDERNWLGPVPDATIDALVPAYPAAAPGIAATVQAAVRGLEIRASGPAMSLLLDGRLEACRVTMSDGAGRGTGTLGIARDGCDARALDYVSLPDVRLEVWGRTEVRESRFAAVKLEGDGPATAGRLVIRGDAGATEVGTDVLASAAYAGVTLEPEGQLHVGRDVVMEPGAAPSDGLGLGAGTQLLIGRALLLGNGGSVTPLLRADATSTVRFTGGGSHVLKADVQPDEDPAAGNRFGALELQGGALRLDSDVVLRGRLEITGPATVEAPVGRHRALVVGSPSEAIRAGVAVAGVRFERVALTVQVDGVSQVTRLQDIIFAGHDSGQDGYVPLRLVTWGPATEALTLPRLSFASLVDFQPVDPWLYVRAGNAGVGALALTLDDARVGGLPPDLDDVTPRSVQEGEGSITWTAGQPGNLRVEPSPQSTGHVRVQNAQYDIDCVMTGQATSGRCSATVPPSATVELTATPADPAQDVFVAMLDRENFFAAWSCDMLPNRCTVIAPAQGSGVVTVTSWRAAPNERVWRGGLSSAPTDWSEGANWGPEPAAPEGGTDARIAPYSGTLFIPEVTAGAVVRNLNVGQAAYLVVNDGDLRLSGGLAGNGVLSGNGGSVTLAAGGSGGIASSVGGLSTLHLRLERPFRFDGTLDGGIGRVTVFTGGSLEVASGTQLTVLDTLDVSRASALAFIGPSADSATTRLRVLGTLRLPDVDESVGDNGGVRIDRGTLEADGVVVGGRLNALTKPTLIVRPGASMEMFVGQSRIDLNAEPGTDAGYAIASLAVLPATQGALLTLERDLVVDGRLQVGLPQLPLEIRAGAAPTSLSARLATPAANVRNTTFRRVRLDLENVPGVPVQYDLRNLTFRDFSIDTPRPTPLRIACSGPTSVNATVRDAVWDPISPQAPAEVNFVEFDVTEACTQQFPQLLLLNATTGIPMTNPNLPFLRSRTLTLGVVSPGENVIWDPPQVPQ